MKRYDFENAVYESTLDPQSKAILACYAYHKNWGSDGKVWASSKVIAKETGLSEATVKRRVPLLVKAGWLKYQGDTKYSGGRPSKVYDLGIGDEDFSITEHKFSITESDFSITEHSLSYQSDTLISKEQEEEQVKEQEGTNSRDEDEGKKQHSPSGRVPAAPVDNEPSLDSFNDLEEDNDSSSLDSNELPLESSKGSVEVNESSFMDSTVLDSNETVSESSLDTEDSVLDIQSSLKSCTSFDNFFDYNPDAKQDMMNGIIPLVVRTEIGNGKHFFGKTFNPLGKHLVLVDDPADEEENPKRDWSREEILKAMKDNNIPLTWIDNILYVQEKKWCLATRLSDWVLGAATIVDASMDACVFQKPTPVISHGRAQTALQYDPADW